MLFFYTVQRFFAAVAVFFKLIPQIWQTAYGYFRVMRLGQPTVSIFGSSRLSLESETARQAAFLAGALIDQHISVMTGGGPGIMEASNCGAQAAIKRKEGDGARSLGIGITGVHSDHVPSACAVPFVMVDYFFARKWLLIEYSIGYIFFPGGLGTFDELSDLLNLMQTGRIPSAPVVLVGVAFWHSYIQQLALMRERGYLSRTDEPRLVVTDDLDHIIELMIEHCRACRLHKGS